MLCLGLQRAYGVLFVCATCCMLLQVVWCATCCVWAYRGRTACCSCVLHVVCCCRLSGVQHVVSGPTEGVRRAVRVCYMLYVVAGCLVCNMLCLGLQRAYGVLFVCATCCMLLQ